MQNSTFNGAANSVNCKLSSVNSLGRTQLAQLYFPYIQPQSAWLKLKTLLLEDPALCHLATLRRRTFLPAEVNKIYQSLGQPWAAFFGALSPFRVSCHETQTFISRNSHFPAYKLQVSTPHRWTYYFADGNVKQFAFYIHHAVTQGHRVICEIECLDRILVIYVTILYYIIYIIIYII